MNVVVAADDPRRDEVRVVVERHLAFAREVTPPEGVYAVGADGLLHPTVSFFSARLGRPDGDVVGIVALKELDPTLAEIKSLHTIEAARGQGVARTLVEHVVAVARDRRYVRLSLETGNMDAFAPARALYASLGFEPCEAFGEYIGSATSACMTIGLEPGPSTPSSR